MTRGSRTLGPAPIIVGPSQVTARAGCADAGIGHERACGPGSSTTSAARPRASRPVKATAAESADQTSGEVTAPCQAAAPSSQTVRPRTRTRGPAAPPRRTKTSAAWTIRRSIVHPGSGRRATRATFSSPSFAGDATQRLAGRAHRELGLGDEANLLGDLVSGEPLAQELAKLRLAH